MIGPAVIHAVKLPSIALTLAADQGAAVAAAVEQRADGAFAVAAKNDRAPRHGAGLEVTGIFQFRSMADIDPAAVEDGALLALQHVLGDEDLAIDEKGLGIPV